MLYLDELLVTIALLIAFLFVQDCVVELLAFTKCVRIYNDGFVRKCVGTSLFDGHLVYGVLCVLVAFTEIYGAKSLPMRCLASFLMAVCRCGLLSFA